MVWTILKKEDRFPEKASKQETKRKLPMRQQGSRQEQQVMKNVMLCKYCVPPIT
jgi:hypothetical protein